MTKTISLFSFSICILLLLTVYATASDKPNPYEEIYPEIGYKTVDEALNDAEHHFKQKIKLPLRVPPISFTHHFGRLSDLDGAINDSFELKFISDKSSENHYKINVRPIEYKISIPEKYVIKSFELKKDVEAIYMTIPGFNILVFEKDNWQYMLSIDKRVSDKVSLNTLVEIANSIDY